MSIRVALTHTTRYRYDRAVTLAPHVVRLRPAPHSRTIIPSYSLRIKPEEHFLNWQQDPFGNHQARLAFTRPARELTVEVDLIADMATINPFDFFVESYAENYPFVYEPALAAELAPYREPVVAGPRVAALVDELRAGQATAGRRNIDVLVDINRELSRRLRYDIRMEPGVFEPEETHGARPRVVPRLRLAGGGDHAPPRLRRALRVGVFDPAQARRRRHRRSVGRQRGRRRSARLDRGLPARRRLDRPRFDQWPARRRGPHPARLHRAAVDGGADLGFVFFFGRGRGREPDRRGVHLRDEGAPPCRDAAGHRAVPRRSVEGDPGARAAGRPRSGTARRSPDDGRRADLRFDRRSRRARMEHRRARLG